MTLARYLPVLAVAGMAMAGTVAYHFHTQSQARFFFEALSRAQINERVVVDGREYEINGALLLAKNSPPLRVLRLAYEKSAARRSPVLALPGLDTAELRASTALLARARSEFASRQDSSEEAALIENGFYPTGMLLALSRAEDARIEFLEAGTESAARAYRSAVQSATDAYMRDLEAFTRSFIRAVPSDIRNYAVPSKIISREETLAILASMRAGVRDAKRDLARRSACFDGAYILCASSDVELPFSAPDDANATPSQLSLAQEVAGAATGASFAFDGLLDGRLIHLSRAFCTARDATGAALFGVRAVNTYAGVPRPVPMYLGNWYFIEVSRGSSMASLPYLRSFIEKGLSYVPMHPLIYYECPDAAQDQGSVLAVREVFLIATQTPYSSLATRTEDATALRALEAKLSGRTVEEADAAVYLARALKLELPRVERNALEDAAVRFSYRSQGLRAAILDIVEAEETNMRLAAEGIDIDFSALNLYFTRSAFAALFLSGHPSLGEVSSFDDNHLTGAQQPYRLYSELRERGFGAAKLKEALSLYHASYEF